jgi:hypothetical protein
MCKDWTSLWTNAQRPGTAVYHVLSSTDALASLGHFCSCQLCGNKCAAAPDRCGRPRLTDAATAAAAPHTLPGVTDPAAAAAAAGGGGGVEVVAPVGAVAVELLLLLLLLLLLGSSCIARCCAASPVIMNGLFQQRSTAQHTIYSIPQYHLYLSTSQLRLQAMMAPRLVCIRTVRSQVMQAGQLEGGHCSSCGPRIISMQNQLSLTTLRTRPGPQMGMTSSPGATNRPKTQSAQQMTHDPAETDTRQQASMLCTSHCFDSIKVSLPASLSVPVSMSYTYMYIYGTDPYIYI